MADESTTSPDHHSTWMYDREADHDIEVLFPWREMTPDEYAARYGHNVWCYSFHRMRFRNPEIGRWAVRLGELLTDSDKMERVRREILSPAEYAEVQQRIADDALLAVADVAGSAEEAKMPRLSSYHSVTETILYKEWFASGHSRKNIFTQLGGARGCLKLVVTNAFLHVSILFPFSLGAGLFDLNHTIPRSRIVSVRRTRYFFRTAIIVTFRDAAELEGTLCLHPRRPDAFLESLGGETTAP